MNGDQRTYLRILHLEDSVLDAELIVRALRRGGVDFLPKRVQTRADFERELVQFAPDIILADYNVPDFNGSDALGVVRERAPQVPFIIVSGAVGEDTAIELMRRGATDFVFKERIGSSLVQAIRRAMNEVWNKRARKMAEDQREQLNNELQYVANHDQLTGAASRVLFQARLRETLLSIREGAADSAYLHIDIDRFKFVNDNYGTLVGDQVLVEISRRLHDLCKEGDLVGNFCGDRFYIIIHELSQHGGINAFLGRLNDCFLKFYRVHGTSIRIHASIGVVLLKNPGMLPEEAMLQGEEAMRHVKNKLREGNVCIADQEIIGKLMERNALDQQSLKAFDEGNLFLVFQPIVDLETNSIYGAEALIRCRNPDGSIIPAAKFIRSLERMKYPPAIDEWVLDCFLEIVGPMMGKQDFRFSLNVSAASFSTRDYAERVLSKARRAGLSPSSLTLEVLEEGLISEELFLQENLRKFRSAGVLIAIDDFGTGQSSLTRLASLPIDEVKIERSFVSGITKNDSPRKAVLSAAVSIAKSLGCFIVAEGIDDREQVDHLRRIGCRYGQGYLFAKPMEFDDLLNFVKARG